MKKKNMILVLMMLCVLIFAISGVEAKAIPIPKSITMAVGQNFHIIATDCAKLKSLSKLKASNSSAEILYWLDNGCFAINGEKTGKVNLKYATKNKTGKIAVTIKKDPKYIGLFGDPNYVKTKVDLDVWIIDGKYYAEFQKGATYCSSLMKCYKNSKNNLYFESSDNQKIKVAFKGKTAKVKLLTAWGTDKKGKTYTLKRNYVDYISQYKWHFY